jgi:hypothetical protein
MFSTDFYRARPLRCRARRRNCPPLLTLGKPAFGHRMIDSLPYFVGHNRRGGGCLGLGGVALVGECSMGSDRDHRKCAEECVAMARAAEDAKDKALWITLAQSWLRLAEHVAHVSAAGYSAEAGEEALAAQSAE